MKSRFIESYMKWFLQSTDAPVAFGTASALMSLSTIALGRRWLVGADIVNANLYMMLVGPSSRARKSTSIKRSREIIEEVNEQRIGPTDYTAEGLFKWMQEKDETTGKSRTRLTLFASEFAADLARSAGYKNSFRDDLTNLYDGFDINKVRSGFAKGVTIASPRVSVFAAVTYEGLRANTTSTDWHTGFLMRFMYVTPMEWRELRVLPAEADPVARDSVAYTLRQIKEELQATPMGLRLDEDAKQLYADTFLAHMKAQQAEKGESEREAPAEVYMQRFWPNVRKLALLYQLDVDPQQPVGYEAMEKAITFAGNCWGGYVKAFQETTIGDFGTLCTAVLDKIKAQGEILISELPIHFGNSMQLSAVIKYIEATGQCRRIVLPNGVAKLLKA